MTDMKAGSISIAPGYTVEVVGPMAVMLLDGEHYDVLEGTAVVRIFQCLLEGLRDAGEIARRLHAEIPGEQVSTTLSHLLRDGFIVAHLPGLTPTMVEMAAAFEIPSRQVLDALQGGRVEIESYDAEAGFVEAALKDLEVQIGVPATVKVVVVGDYLHPRLAELNGEALHTGRPWMLVKPVGKIPYIGPLFIPGKTACWACLARRLCHNRDAPRFLAYCNRPFAIPAADRALSYLETLVARIAACELVQWMLCGSNNRLEGQVLRLVSATRQQTFHPVRRLPQCPFCGNGSAIQKPRPLVLRPRKKRYTDDGGHRVLSPEAAFESYKHHVDPLTGVVRSLRRLEAPPGAPLHTYVAEHALVVVIDSLEKLYMNEEVGSSGKGKTEAQARASALFEALERLSAVWQGTEYRVLGSYQALKPAAIHPAELLGFSARQYATRTAWNAACLSPALRVPEPFDEGEAVTWVPAWSLSRETFRFVPASYAYFGYPDTDHPFCYADSNGNAAGVTLEGAILQGFFELVERDATAIWFYNRLGRPGVDLKSFEDPYVDALGAYYRTTLHRDLWVLDVTSDLGIASLVAVSRRTGPGPEDILMGFGCHLDPHMALSRALTELNQILHGMMRRGSGDARCVRDPMMQTWMQAAVLEAHPYLAPDPHLPPRMREDYPRQWSDDLLEDLRACTARAASCGLDVHVLDLTREDIGLPVVKVVVPGLVHYWRRLGPGRLYEIPVKMGWLPAARAEEAMNPFSIVV